MMKLVGIGDLFIPCEYIEQGMKPLEGRGISVSTVEWKLNGFDELQNINLKVEQGGREEVEIPDYILDAVKDADIIITQFFPVGKELIDACKNLKYIGVLRAGYENVNFYSDAEEMLKNEKLDGVCIGTRCSLHTHYALLVAKYNIPMFLEKPVSISYDELNKLKEITQW